MSSTSLQAAIEKFAKSLELSEWQDGASVISRRLSDAISLHVRQEVSAAIEQLREELQMEIHYVQNSRKEVPVRSTDGPFALEVFSPGMMCPLSMPMVNTERNPTASDLLDAFNSPAIMSIPDRESLALGSGW